MSGVEHGSKPRNNALHYVCCVETIKTPLSRRQQTKCFRTALAALRLILCKSFKFARSWSLSVVEVTITGQKLVKNIPKKQEPALGVFHSAKRLHPFGVAECFASQNPPTPTLGFAQLFQVLLRKTCRVC